MIQLSFIANKGPVSNGLGVIDELVLGKLGSVVAACNESKHSKTDCFLYSGKFRLLDSLGFEIDAKEI